MILATSVPFLLLSVAIRLWQEGSPILVLADTILISLLIRWGHYGLTAYTVASLAFTLVAYIETLIEYSDHSQNLREREALESKCNSSKYVRVPKVIAATYNA